MGSTKAREACAMFLMECDAVIAIREPQEIWVPDIVWLE